jgi:NAD-dependent dihydropyrimidine dehydrogenase PreA subunit
MPFFPFGKMYYFCELIVRIDMEQKDFFITVCRCSSPRIEKSDEIVRLASALKNAGFTVAVIHDLCKVAITDARLMADIASTTIVACYPRAVRALFGSAGLQPPQRIFDIRNHSGEQILNEMGIEQPVFLPEFILPEPEPALSPLLEAGGERPAWYPVIDKERCTDCGKCHDFCLFGVYAVSEGVVKVSQPRNCKDNCPACARVCPSKAIIFPKYDKSPINGGLQDEEPLAGTDAKSLYNTALRYKLEERRAKVSLLKRKPL